MAKNVAQPPGLDHDDLFRLRRCGWVMIGDLKVVDRLMQRELLTLGLVRTERGGEGCQSILMASVFPVLARCASDGYANTGEGVKDTTMIKWIAKLSTFERIVVATMVVEEMTTEEVAALTGRPASMIERTFDRLEAGLTDLEARTLP